MLSNLCSFKTTRPAMFLGAYSQDKHVQMFCLALAVNHREWAFGVVQYVHECVCGYVCKYPSLIDLLYPRFVLLIISGASITPLGAFTVQADRRTRFQVLSSVRGPRHPPGPFLATPLGYVMKSKRGIAYCDKVILQQRVE